MLCREEWAIEYDPDSLTITPTHKEIALPFTLAFEGGSNVSQNATFPLLELEPALAMKLAELTNAKSLHPPE
jgi:hypothetical protein